VRWLALVVSALAAAFVAGYLSATRAALAFAGLLAAALVLTQGLFRGGWILSVSEMLLSASLALVAAIVFRTLSAEKRGAIFRGAIALFVGKKVARALDESGAMPAGGSRQMVTILFSDIRGFTAFCDEKPPELVVDLLNQYLQNMVAIIVRHGGHVNKFIGDGILAIFSDEDAATPGDHPSRAIRCGVEMAQAPGAFRTGVGIHTGVALVGCVGSSEKMEFTALGDTVNLASRLESLNKEHHTQLVMSDATRALLEAEIETICLGEVQVRGRTAPMNIFTAAALHPAARDAAASVEHR
jgi:adenylate cyclase